MFPFPVTPAPPKFSFLSIWQRLSTSLSSPGSELGYAPKSRVSLYWALGISLSQPPPCYCSLTFWLSYVFTQTYFISSLRFPDCVYQNCSFFIARWWKCFFFFFNFHSLEMYLNWGWIFLLVPTVCINIFMILSVYLSLLSFRYMIVWIYFWTLCSVESLCAKVILFIAYRVNCCNL